MLAAVMVVKIPELRKIKATGAVRLADEIVVNGKPMAIDLALNEIRIIIMAIQIRLNRI